MRIAMLVGTLLALSGCSTTADGTTFTDAIYGEGVSKMTLPDGRQGYLVNCDARGFDACYSRSREICKGDFEVINRTDRAGEDEDERRIEMACKT